MNPDDYDFENDTLEKKARRIRHHFGTMDLNSPCYITDVDVADLLPVLDAFLEQNKQIEELRKRADHFEAMYDSHEQWIRTR